MATKNINKDDTPEWLKKCMQCAHVYTTKGDAEEIRCRCKKGCNFKQIKSNQKE